MLKIIFSAVLCGMLWLCGGCAARDPLWASAGGARAGGLSEGEGLLDHLAGKWTLTGTLGGKATVHDVEAHWVLNREYLALHEVLREKATNGVPAYEAIVMLSCEPKTGECCCLWLDTTGGSGLSNEVIGRGRVAAVEIPFVFKLQGGLLLRNKFVYSPAADTWTWTIDSEQGGKTESFGQVTLVRK